MPVFNLNIDIENYRCVTPVELVEHVEYDCLAFNHQFYDDVSLAHRWEPCRLVYVDAPYPIGDFPGFPSTPVFSGRAVEALRDLLEPNGELLPTICPTHELWIYKVLNFVDALDETRSDIDWFGQVAKDRGKPRRVRSIRRYEFINDQPPSAAIFKLRQQPIIHVYVNEEFRQRVLDAGLTGFEFKQVWPTPDDSASRQQFLEKRRRKKGR